MAFCCSWKLVGAEIFLPRRHRESGYALKLRPRVFESTVHGFEVLTESFESGVETKNLDLAIGKTKGTLFFRRNRDERKCIRRKRKKFDEHREVQRRSFCEL